MKLIDGNTYIVLNRWGYPRSYVCSPYTKFHLRVMSERGLCWDATHEGHEASNATGQLLRYNAKQENRKTIW